VTDDFGDADFGGDGPRILPATCTHYCETGHFDGDDMVMVDMERLHWKGLAAEILSDLLDAQGYIGDYFWQKWYARDVERYQRALHGP
jgi:hypothetical protein